MNARTLRATALTVFMVAGCESAPQATTRPREVPQHTIEDFMSNTEVFGTSLSPDKSKVLVSSNSTGIFNAFAIPVAGGEPVQLTKSAESVFVVSYFPNDERFLYSSDRGGNELSHIYVQAPDGTVKDLTPGEKHTSSFTGWSWDRKSFFITTNERNPQYFDLYEYETDGYARKLVYENKEGLDVSVISRDKRYIALVKPITTSNSDIYLYDTQTKQTKLITPHEGDVNSSPQAFSPDSASLYFTTDEGSEFAYLRRYDLATGQRSTVLQPNWDVWVASF
jgi:Tol biopolymer transport system component